MAKLNQHSTDDEGGDSWLLSYADMMTLIACFFILMMAFANFDPVGFTKKTEVISKHFNKDKFKSSDIKLSHLQEEVAKHPEIETMTKITKENGELVISFSGSTVFEKNSFNLSNTAVQNLDIMIEIIQKMDPDYQIIAEGHADKYEGREPENTLGIWGLSSARAGSVIERFEFHGYSPSQLTALGRGDSKPLFPSVDKDGKPILNNQIMNQRVSIKLLTNYAKKGTSVKLGLGVYFDK